MPTNYTNQHDRKPGRGLRPWLLIPKYLCVSIYLGGLVSMVFLGIYFDHWPNTHHAMLYTMGLWVLLPAAVLSGLLGVALWMQHALHFMRMRWFRLKVFLLAFLLPASNLAAWWHLHKLITGYQKAAERAVEDTTLSYFIYVSEDFGTSPEILHAYYVIALIGAAVTVVAIAILGRLKPRLGQKFGSRRNGVTEATRSEAQHTSERAM